jgi:hypothetical protein
VTSARSRLPSLAGSADRSQSREALVLLSYVCLRVLDTRRAAEVDLA